MTTISLQVAQLACAQGSSAGSAAIAYALAWYGAGDSTVQNGGYLDNVELLAGPPLSDIYEGCEYPRDGAVTVCGTGGVAACARGPPGWLSDPPPGLSPARTGAMRGTHFPQAT